MSDESVIIVDPSGTEHEFPAGFDPRKAALKVRDEYRAAEDVKAAGAQQKAEAGSTFGSQMTPSNVLHDLGTAAGAGWDVVKTLVKEGWKNPLGINQPNIQLSPERLAEIQREGIAGAFKQGPSLGTLRTLPTTANPITALQEAGVTPDMAAHAGGTVAALGAVGATLPNAGRLTTSTGNLVTRAGQAMNPAMTKTLGEGVGALAEAGLGGASGSPTMGGLGRVFAGSKIGGAIGEAVPAMTRGTGRLITKAGQFMGSATGTPAGLIPPKPPVQPNTLLRADDLKGMLEEAMAQRDVPTSTTAPPERTVTPGGRPSLTAQEYAELEQGSPGAGAHAGAPESAYAPNPVSEPTGPPPRLVKGGGPSLHDALITALEDVRQGESEPGTTPPERTVTATGKPSVTPQEYAALEQGSPGAGAYTGTPESAYEPVPERTGPPPRLVKGEAPSLHDALVTAMEEVRQGESGAGTTPPDVTLTPAGKPSVTPERYSQMGETAPPAGTTRQIQPEVPPTLPKPGNPIPADDLIGMLEEARQQPANDPVTTASGAPPQELTPGGRPSQTQAEYDALQEAAMRRQALEKAVGAQTASSAAQAEKPAAAAVTNPWERLSTAEELAQTGELHHNNADIHAKLLQDGNGAPYTLELTEQGNRQTIPLNTTDRVNASYAAVERFNTALDKVREARAAARGEGVTATEGVKPPPPMLDPEAQAVRDQTAAAPETAVVNRPTVQEMIANYRPIGAGTPTPPEAPPSGSAAFTADLSPRARVRAEAALDQSVMNNGRPTARRTLVENKIQQGAQIVETPSGRRLQTPDGAFLTESQISKTAMDYAQHLVDARTGAGGVSQPEAAGVAERPSPEGTGTIPSREQMTQDELSRAREGGRDSPDRQKGETLEDYRLRTRGRATGDKSAEPSIIPARRAGAIDDTIESMYERNATDQEFRDYLAKSKNHPKNGEIAAKIESKAHSYKRPSPLAHVIAGAALTGAALRQALVGQLQGDQKQEQD